MKGLQLHDQLCINMNNLMIRITTAVFQHSPHSIYIHLGQLTGVFVCLVTVDIEKRHFTTQYASQGSETTNQTCRDLGQLPISKDVMSRFKLSLIWSKSRTQILPSLSYTQFVTVQTLMYR